MEKYKEYANNYEKYRKIVNEILDIIERANHKKVSISVEEYKKNYRNYFTRIFFSDILNEDAKRLRELLDLERTLNLLVYREDFTLKNGDLLSQCQALFDETNNTTYLELTEILNRANNRDIIDLIEYYGYLVLKEDLITFIDLCRQLHIGPSARVFDLSLEEAIGDAGEKLKYYHQKEQERRKEQYVRIMRAFTVRKAQKQDEDVKKILETKDSQSVRVSESELQDIVFNSHYSELVSYGLMNQLTIRMLTNLKEKYNLGQFSTIFDNLLNELLAWGAIKKEEYLLLKSLNNHTKVLSNIDELVNYLASLENLDVKGLKIFANTLDIDDYYYLSYILFISGIINKFEYDEMLKINMEDRKV